MCRWKRQPPQEQRKCSFLDKIILGRFNTLLLCLCQFLPLCVAYSLNLFTLLHLLSFDPHVDPCCLPSLVFLWKLIVIGLIHERNQSLQILSDSSDRESNTTAELKLIILLLTYSSWCISMLSRTSHPLIYYSFIIVL